MTIAEEIKELEDRKNIVSYSRKITTSISNVIMFDAELATIDDKIEQLNKSGIEKL